jgi:hypothetical protein
MQLLSKQLEAEVQKADNQHLLKMLKEQKLLRSMSDESTELDLANGEAENLDEL